MPTVALCTLGCRLNQADTQALRERFLAQGYAEVPFGTAADVTVVNTCAVTGQSETDSRRMLRRAGRASPKGRVVAAGCSADLHPQELARLPGVTLVAGTAFKPNIPQLVQVQRPGESPHVTVGALDDVPFDDATITHFGGRTRAFVKVQEGCDRACAYCSIRLSRGRARSRSLDSTLEQVQTLTQRGFREIVLTGVDLGSYGRERGGAATNLRTLLRRLDVFEGRFRYRLSSIDPADLNEAFISTLATSPRWAPHLHIPLQSGNEATLARMERGYTAEHFSLIANAVKRHSPHCAIGTDLMVGFPGEDEAAFERSYAFVDSSPIDYFHVFRFSPRPGTPAATYSEQVDEGTKKRRATILRHLGVAKWTAFQGRQVGRACDVLVQSAPDEAGVVRALADNYVKVHCPGLGDSALGALVPVRMDRFDGVTMWADAAV
jgi:threonylcarbamoyladenosine tRNA methylthiotransferase MtaB